MKNSILFSLILILSQSVNAQWTRLTGPGGGDISCSCLTRSGSNIYAGTVDSGVFVSTNNGTNWILINNGLTNLNIYSIAVSGSSLFAGSGSGVFLSTNNGVNWNLSGLNGYQISAIAIQSTVILAGGGGWNGIYRSTNNGLNWIQSGLGNLFVGCIFISGNNIYSGAFHGIGGGAVWLSTNNGVNWSEISYGIPSTDVRDINATGNYLFAGLYSSPAGVYRSSIYGGNWESVGLPYQSIYSLAVTGNTIFASVGNGVFMSTNYGTNWITINEGFASQILIKDLLISNNYIFAADPFFTSIWRRPLSDVLGIEPNSGNVPSSFSLSQNYPNPFNPVTKIKFDISSNVKRQTANVKLIVYDILGKEITTLVNEQLQPGSYEVSFDGSNLPSGIYFYQFRTGDFVQTKKLILLK